MVDTSHVLAAENAAENLLALSQGFGAWSSRRDDYVIADSGTRGCRVCVTRPPADTAAVISEMISLAAQHVPGKPFYVEDTLSTLPLEHHGFMPLARVPVMVRPAGMAFPGPPPPGSIEVIAVDKQDGVDEVERVMVDASPIPAMQPWHSGVLFPPAALDVPGWVMWLARRDGETLGCCATQDDGSSVGLYGMAVYPHARRQGIGRALVAAIVQRYPAIPGCLASTDEGFWLYARTGYHTVGVATLWKQAQQ
jgi:GNAT superfamily N-acetyltransferase